MKGNFSILQWLLEMSLQFLQLLLPQGNSLAAEPLRFPFYGRQLFPQLAWRWLTSQMLRWYICAWNLNETVWESQVVWDGIATTSYSTCWICGCVTWKIDWTNVINQHNQVNDCLDVSAARASLFWQVTWWVKPGQPIGSQAELWEVRKKPLLEVGRFCWVFSGNVAVWVSESFSWNFKHSMSQKHKVFFSALKASSPDVIRPPCHWVFYDCSCCPWVLA